MSGQRQRNFEITWPLFGDAQSQPFPVDPHQTLSPFAPPSEELARLARTSELPPETTEQVEREARKLRESLPPTAPEWMRAARALADWLETRIARGTVNPGEQAAIARTWAAFALGGATDPQILRVAHLVHRAHVAVRELPRDDRLQIALRAAASVVHSGLPSSVRKRMPLERAVYVTRMLHDEIDSWAAIVEGTAELLGWKDYARVHAASVIRAVLEKNRG
ncbi:MAG TPA: hypothetical protein VM686_42360 [Polyangiaceae bacterium]|jgi:hypothetical protein|nr:hypothetical protein [Polyangiaceae bacterium]